MMFILSVFAGSFGEPGWSMGQEQGSGACWLLAAGQGGVGFLQWRQQQRQQQQQQQLLRGGHHRQQQCHRLHCLHHLWVQAGGLQVAGGAVAELRVFNSSSRM